MRRLSLVLVAVLAPIPALAGFDCPGGGAVIRVVLLPQSFGGVDYCVPDKVDPSLLVTDPRTIICWQVDSMCQGEHTVSIIGDNTKANINASLACQPQYQYPGPVSGDVSLICPPLPLGKYGYRVAVCLGNACASTDPGIWVNDGLAAPTPAELEASQAEVKRLHYGTRADLEKTRKRTPAKKPAAPGGAKK